MSPKRDRSTWSIGAQRLTSSSTSPPKSTMRSCSSRSLSFAAWAASSTCLAFHRCQLWSKFCRMRGEGLALSDGRGISRSLASRMPCSHSSRTLNFREIVRRVREPGRSRRLFWRWCGTALVYPFKIVMIIDL